MYSVVKTGDGYDRLPEYHYSAETKKLTRADHRIAWEYKQLTMPSLEEMNIVGRNGWELVAIDGQWHVFKRQMVMEHD